MVAKGDRVRENGSEADVDADAEAQTDTNGHLQSFPLALSSARSCRTAGNLESASVAVPVANETASEADADAGSEELLLRGRVQRSCSADSACAEAEAEAGASETVLFGAASTAQPYSAAVQTDLQAARDAEPCTAFEAVQAGSGRRRTPGPGEGQGNGGGTVGC